VVLSVDFRAVIAEVHPSLVDSVHGQTKSISNDTLSKLQGVVDSLKQEKRRRLQKVIPFFFSFPLNNNFFFLGGFAIGHL